MGPDVCQIENVDLVGFPELFGLLGGHGLDFERPFGEVALLDGLVEILLGVVGGVVGGIFLGDEFYALLGLHVELAVDPFAFLVDELDGMAEVAVHVSISVGDTTIAHEDHDLVDRLWVLGEVVPEHGRVIGVCKMG